MTLLCFDRGRLVPQAAQMLAVLHTAQVYGLRSQDYDLKSAPHPHAALLFLDLLHGQEGQKVIQDANRIPTHPQVLPNPARLREGFQFIMVDPAKYLDKIDHYSRLWRDWMLK